MPKKSAIVLMLACVAASAFGADLSIPYIGLLTNGRLNAAGAFELSTRVGIDMLIEGGAKFDAWFKLGFRTAAVEEYLRAAESLTSVPADATLADLAESASNLEAATGLSLRTVAIQVKGLFGTPLEMATFVGHLDTFCSGSDFTTLFGASDFATKFRGYMYYPDGIGGDPSRRYDGLHEAYGTGLRFSYPLESIRPYLYAYQDSWLGAGYYSLDARALVDADNVKLEAFAGASFPVSAVGVYRAGLLFYFDTGAIGDFYAQIGIPRWDPTEAFRMDMLYFMFEPRVDFGPGELVLSLFFHPAYYLQRATSESGAMEFRFDIGFGAITEGSFRSGVEAELSYNPNLDTNTLTMDAAPYLQTIRNGVRWDIRLAIRAFPFPDPWYGMFMPTVGISTAF
ncbi:MAG: hypothetical protein KKA67_01645 [Spirochaetes bacterium]|nr:hypothetical protein [Spirochaetota bacterium]MBU1082413.1 hypothetical protein [Spirochaetota bacterium]